MRTVNAAVREGITSIATVHDSFGCLPSKAERFRRIIRERFVQMYKEHDVLAEVLECVRKDLGENAKGLPARRQIGALWTLGRFWKQSLPSPDDDVSQGRSGKALFPRGTNPHTS